MATTKYTDDVDQLVFLNDKCIAQTSSDIERIGYNAIPSLSLFNIEDAKLVQRDLDIEVSSYGISARVDELCSQVSSKIDENFKNLTDSIADAMTKAEKQSISAIGDAAKYSDALSTELCGTVNVRVSEAKQELSNALSSYTDNEVKAFSDIAKSSYAKYNDFTFEYDADRHLIQLTLKNEDGKTLTQSIESTDFIKNRIIDHIDITDDGKYLRIFWKNSTSSEDHVDIEIADLVKVYSAGDGISIVSSEVGPYVISVNDTIARQTTLDAVAATVKTLSTDTIGQIDERIDNVISDIKTIQAYDVQLSGPDGIVQTLSNSITSLNTKTDITNSNVTKANAEIDSLKAYANELSDTSDDTPGTIKQLKIKDADLESQISKLRTDVSATIAIVGHIKLTRGKAYNDNTLSGIFEYYHFAEIGTLRNGNAYSVEIEDLDGTLTDLSAAFFDTKDDPSIRLAHGDYVIIHSHTADPVTLATLTENIVIAPSVKQYSLYSLSSELNDEILARISADNVEKARATSAEANLSVAIDSKVYIDGLSAASLSAIHINADEYYEKVKAGSILSNELYVISGDYINVYGQQIKHVGSPTDNADATTKEYVDSQAKSISTLLSTGIQTLSTNLSVDVDKLSADLSNVISSQILALSNSLSNEIDALSDALSNDLSTNINALKDIDQQLSNSISSKIYIDNSSAASLSVMHIDADKYYERVKSGDILSNEIYIISSDYVNAYNQQIKYVAEPTDASDAVTKKYVDDKLSTAEDKIISIQSDITTLQTGLATTNTNVGIVSLSVSGMAMTLKKELSTFANDTSTYELNDVVKALSSIYSIVSSMV